MTSLILRQTERLTDHRQRRRAVKKTIVLFKNLLIYRRGLVLRPVTAARNAIVAEWLATFTVK